MAAAVLVLGTPRGAAAGWASSDTASSSDESSSTSGPSLSAELTTEPFTTLWKICLLREDLIPCITILFSLPFNSLMMNQVGFCFRQLGFENKQHPLLLARNLVLGFGLLIHFGSHRIPNVLRTTQYFQNLHQLEGDILLKRSSISSPALILTWSVERGSMRELRPRSRPAQMALLSLGLTAGSHPNTFAFAKAFVGLRVPMGRTSHQCLTFNTAGAAPEAPRGIPDPPSSLALKESVMSRSIRQSPREQGPCRVRTQDLSAHLCVTDQASAWQGDVTQRLQKLAILPTVVVVVVVVAVVAVVAVVVAVAVAVSECVFNACISTT